MDYSPITQGYQSIIPSLNVADGVAAIEFYSVAFGAHESFRLSSPDHKVMHSVLEIGDSVIFLADEAPEWGALSPARMGGCPMSLLLYVPDCDMATTQAVDAGAKILHEPTDYPWGERTSLIIDPFGYRWGLCTRTEDVPPEELARRMQEWSGPEPVRAELGQDAVP